MFKDDCPCTAYCSKRQPGCHTICIAYLAYEENRKCKKKQIDDVRRSEHATVSYVSKRYYEWRRKNVDRKLY